MAQTTIPEEMIEQSRAVVTNASKANPCVITTSAAHGLLTNDRVYLVELGGMTELNNREYVITKINATSFSLNSENSTAYTTYTSGGIAIHRLGTAAALNVGVLANEVVQLDGSAKLPAVDGSQLTNVSTGLQLVGTQALVGLSTHAFTGISSASRELVLVVTEEAYGVADSTRVQLGHAGSYITSGYEGSLLMVSRSPSVNNFKDYTAGIDLHDADRTNVQSLVLRFVKGNADVWQCDVNGYREGVTAGVRHPLRGAAYVDVTATLDRLKLLSVGSQTWSQGQATLYEL